MPFAAVNPKISINSLHSAFCEGTLYDFKRDLAQKGIMSIFDG